MLGSTLSASTDYNEYMEVKEDILPQIATILRKHDAQLAVPVSTVHVPEALQLKAASESDAAALPAGMTGRASQG